MLNATDIQLANRQVPLSSGWERIVLWYYLLQSFSSFGAVVAMKAPSLHDPSAEGVSLPPYSYDERLLVAVRHSSAASATVRVESLARWTEDALIHPFHDLLKDHPFIESVHMSISSRATQSFPSMSRLDHVSPLPSPSPPHHHQTAAAPQGFLLSVVPRRQLQEQGPDVVTRAAAVQAVLADLVETRLLTTPVTGATWDVVTTKGFGQDAGHAVYEIVLPLAGAAWSSDALHQALSRTVPAVCHGNDDNGQVEFFGWSPLQWSDFLVGNLGASSGVRNRQSPTRKRMWWTWTASEDTNETTHSRPKHRSLAFGIEYDVVAVSSPRPRSSKEWLPPEFLTPDPSCSVATSHRSTFELTDDNVITRLDGSDQGRDEIASPHVLEYPYQATIEQVLRRQYTNRGRFESWIEIAPLLETRDEMETECQLAYRQVLPEFLSPVWRSLAIDADFGLDGSDTLLQATDDDAVVSSIEWLPNGQGSVLHVQARKTNETGKQRDQLRSRLPSKIVISFDYEPSFLTLDDFPGDPNRGRELPPARVSIDCRKVQPTPVSLPSVTIFSNTLMLLPPVPDMSMPFNVISLTSSLYAYVVGALVTILVRKASEKITYKLYPDKKPESKLQKLKKRIQEKFLRLRRVLRRAASSERVDDRTMILESSQAAQPRSVTWSWLIYGFLLLARVFVAPHLPGYVHPDEFFQGGQELWFGCPPGVPWEFQPQNALRSVVPPLIMTWIPLWMFAAVTQQSTEYLSGYEVLVVPRIFCSLLSVLCVDVAVWKLSAAESSKGGVPVPNLLLASSWPTMVMLSRPFSNTLETICLAMLLATIGTAVRTAEKSNDRLPFTFWFSARVGCICAVGLFTRFTFALFAFPALVFLLYEMIAAFGRAGARCGLWSPLFWMTVFFIFASMGIIAKDTHFYQTLQTGESSGNEMTNPVLTPINALLYNSQVSNLKDHGLHPRWTHAIVNMLILYGPLAFAGYLFIMAAMAAKSPKPPKVQILSLMVATGGLTLLSAAPHQEPRFILPVLVPLVIIGSAAVAVKNQRIFVFLWVTFNFILLLFFGVLHQSGVQKSLLGISSKIPKIDPTIWIYWKTYMPPTFLSRTQENSLGCASNFHVVDLKGSSQLVLFDRIKMQLQCQEHVTPPTVVYLVTPYQVCNSSITNSNYAFAGDEECKLPGDLWRCRYVSSFGPHLTTEDVPPFDGSFAAFYERMSLNLYEISCK